MERVIQIRITPVKSFAYLSRHKCKIKERVEGGEEGKSQVERRIERIEETKKNVQRGLKKDEKIILNIINKHKSLYFDDLLKLTNKPRIELEKALDILHLQLKIRLSRELVDSSWTKHIASNIDYSDEVSSQDLKINKKNNDFIWNLFSYQPCFVCPFIDKCNETNLYVFNPLYCPWLTEWINTSLEGKVYTINFDEIDDNFLT